MERAIVLLNFCMDKIVEVFDSELNELWHRYLNGKKPEYFNYKAKPTTPRQLLEDGLGQMISVYQFVYAEYQNDTNNLSFKQWLLYEWFSKSLKGNNQEILKKARLL